MPPKTLSHCSHSFYFRGGKLVKYLLLCMCHEFRSCLLLLLLRSPSSFALLVQLRVDGTLGADTDSEKFDLFRYSHLNPVSSRVTTDAAAGAEPVAHKEVGLCSHYSSNRKQSFHHVAAPPSSASLLLDSDAPRRNPLATTAAERQK